MQQNNRISRSKVRSINFSPKLLLKNDIKKADLNGPEIKSKLLYNLQIAMHRAKREKQYFLSVVNAKVLLKWVDLEAKIKS